MTEQSVKNEEPRRRQRRRRHGFLAGLILGGLTAVLVGVGVAATTGIAAHRAWGGHGDPERMREHADFAVGYVMDELEATEQQEAEVRAAVIASLDELLALSSRHHENREAFRAEIAQPTVDREALEALRQAELALWDEASSTLVRALGDVSETLSYEQRVELLERLERFRR